MAPSRQDAFAVAQLRCGRGWVTLDPERQREVAFTTAVRQARADAGAARAATQATPTDAATRWAWIQSCAGADDDGARKGHL